LAESLIANPQTALDTLVREELGIDPEGLGGSAWVAAGTSFALFATGALIPLLPYLFIGGLPAAIMSSICGALGLFISGVLGALLTGESLLRTGLRQVGFGLAAAAVTFGLGRMAGAAFGL
jgi:VIT1/CCC1 family predicted Fe2+/Mn2+ transporter